MSGELVTHFNYVSSSVSAGNKVQNNKQNSWQATVTDNYRPTSLGHASARHLQWAATVQSAM